MKFSENLKTLRKQKGYSQEQLAEKLHVSRQAVSKWESDTGLPEMETLLAISEVFSCSIDTLMKESISSIVNDEKERYDMHRNKMNKQYTLGIGTILSGLCMYLFLILFFPENTSQEYIPEIVFLSFVMVGVILLVYTGIQDTCPVETKGKDWYSQQEKEAYQHLFAKMIALGVGILIFAVVIQIIGENILSKGISEFLFMTCATPAICIFIYYGLQKAKYTVQEEKPKTDQKKQSRTDKWCGIIMLIAAIMYLLWSFLGQAWSISWLVFPIGGILCAIVTLLFSQEETK